ncbi:ribonuclease H-like domain-containing protein [Tanacetum coccineum]
MVRSMWLFKHKFHADRTLSHYKACLVSNGSTYQLGVDFDETFSPVVKPATIRKVLSLAVSRKWLIYQLDVKNAFLNSDLSKTLYMHQPPGFVDARFPNHGSQVAYLILYVDDIILMASSTILIQHLIDSLHHEFDMTDLGALNYFLGISAIRHSTVDTESKLGLDEVLVQDPTLYRSIAGGLQYLTFTRLDLSYAVQQICLYMHDPREPHLAALKRILRYVQGTLDLGLHLCASSTTSLVSYTDADWAGCTSTRSAEAEYRGVNNIVAKTTWLHNLLRELHSPLLTATLVYCDNVSAVYMSANPVQHQRMKHIEIEIYFIQDMVTAGQIADGSNSMYLNSTNNFVGRQTWEFDPNYGTPQERDEVEQARLYFWNQWHEFKPCSDVLWRMQFIREKQFKQMIPQVKIENGEEISYEKFTATLMRSVQLISALQADDGHRLAEREGNNGGLDGTCTKARKWILDHGSVAASLWKNMAFSKTFQGYQ